jgi:hypothetical protein
MARANSSGIPDSRIDEDGDEADAVPSEVGPARGRPTSGRDRTPLPTEDRTMEAPTALLSAAGLHHAYGLLFRTLSAWPLPWTVGLAIAVASLPLLVESLLAPSGDRRWRRLPLGGALHGGVALGGLAASGPAFALCAAAAWTFARFLGPSWRLGRHGLWRALPVMAALLTAIAGAGILLVAGLHLLILSHETLEIPTAAATARLRALLGTP